MKRKRKHRRPHQGTGQPPRPTAPPSTKKPKILITYLLFDVAHTDVARRPFRFSVWSIGARRVILWGMGESSKATLSEDSEGLKKAMARTGGSSGHPFRREYLRIADQACRQFGATNSQLAKLFCVSPRTIDNWIREIPEFKEAVYAAKAEADARVERALYERAIGYKHEAEKIFCNKDGLVTKVPYTEHYAPDSVAALFWLKNRRTDEWCRADRVEISGVGGAPLPIINITLNSMDGAARQVHLEQARIVDTAALPGPAADAPTAKAKKSRSAGGRNKKT